MEGTGEEDRALPLALRAEPTEAVGWEWSPTCGGDGSLGRGECFRLSKAASRGEWSGSQAELRARLPEPGWPRGHGHGLGGVERTSGWRELALSSRRAPVFFEAVASWEDCAGDLFSASPGVQPRGAEALSREPDLVLPGVPAGRARAPACLGSFSAPRPGLYGEKFLLYQPGVLGATRVRVSNVDSLALDAGFLGTVAGVRTLVCTPLAPDATDPEARASVPRSMDREEATRDPTAFPVERGSPLEVSV